MEPTGGRKEGGRGEAFVHSATAYATMHGGRGARDTSRGYICEKNAHEALAATK